MTAVVLAPTRPSAPPAAPVRFGSDAPTAPVAAPVRGFGLAGGPRHRSAARLRAATGRARDWFGVVWQALGMAALVAVLAVAVLAVGLPKLAGAVPLTVLSDSMAPAMPVGSLAVVKPTMPLTTDAASLSVEEIERVNDVSKIEPGDVIVYAPEEGSGVMVIHRVLTVSTDTAGRRVFTTKGDNNDTADSPVSGYQVRAVLWYRLPLLGWVNDWLDASTRRAVAVGFAVLAFGWAGWNLIGALRARRARRPEADPVDGEARETGSDAGGGDLLIGRGLL